jgi:hypothetical protein
MRPVTRLAGACARAAEVFHPEINNKAKREKHVLTCFGIRVLQDAAARIGGGYSAEIWASLLYRLAGHKPANLFEELNYRSSRDRKAVSGYATNKRFRNKGVEFWCFIRAGLLVGL